MCLICEKLKNNKMSIDEARKNIMELRILDHIENDHYYEIIQTISQLQKNKDDKKTFSILNKIEE
jgi:hypothetical protein